MEPLKDPKGTQQSVNYLWKWAVTLTCHLPTHFLWNIEIELLVQSGSSWLWTQLPIAPRDDFLEKCKSTSCSRHSHGPPKSPDHQFPVHIRYACPPEVLGEEGGVPSRQLPEHSLLFMPIALIKIGPSWTFNPLGSSSSPMPSNFILSTNFFTKHCFSHTDYRLLSFQSLPHGHSSWMKGMSWVILFPRVTCSQLTPHNFLFSLETLIILE